MGPSSLPKRGFTEVFVVLVQKVAFNPVQIGLIRGARVVLGANSLTHCFQAFAKRPRSNGRAIISKKNVRVMMKFTPNPVGD